MTNATTPTPAQPAAAPASAPLGILSIIAGALGIVFGHTIVIPIAAIVLGFVSRRNEARPHTLANWGIALGFISLFGWLVVGLVFAAAAAPFFLSSLFFIH